VEDTEEDPGLDLAPMIVTDGEIEIAVIAVTETETKVAKKTKSIQKTKKIKKIKRAARSIKNKGADHLRVQTHDH